jgi:hypothetical protein
MLPKTKLLVLAPRVMQQGIAFLSGIQRIGVATCLKVGFIVYP